jgi:hypothetical protein
MVPPRFPPPGEFNASADGGAPGDDEKIRTDSVTFHNHQNLRKNSYFVRRPSGKIKPSLEVKEPIDKEPGRIKKKRPMAQSKFNRMQSP